MGTISSTMGAAGGGEEGAALSNLPSSVRQMQLNEVDFKKEVHPSLRQLLFCKNCILGNLFL
jgi:hypothetical protein